MALLFSLGFVTFEIAPSSPPFFSLLLFFCDINQKMISVIMKDARRRMSCNRLISAFHRIYYILVDELFYLATDTFNRNNAGLITNVSSVDDATSTFHASFSLSLSLTHISDAHDHCHTTTTTTTTTSFFSPRTSRTHRRTSTSSCLHPMKKINIYCHNSSASSPLVSWLNTSFK
jgi:hypothetical protein